MIGSCVHWRSLDHEEILSFCLLKPELINVPLLHLKVCLTESFILHLPLPVFLRIACFLLVLLHPRNLEFIHLLLKKISSIATPLFHQLIMIQLLFEFPLLLFNSVYLLLKSKLFELLDLFLSVSFP